MREVELVRRDLRGGVAAAGLDDGPDVRAVVGGREHGRHGHEFVEGEFFAGGSEERHGLLGWVGVGSGCCMQVLGDWGIKALLVSES